MIVSTGHVLTWWSSLLYLLKCNNWISGTNTVVKIQALKSRYVFTLFSLWVLMSCCVSRLWLSKCFSFEVNWNDNTAQPLMYAKPRLTWQPVQLLPQPCDSSGRYCRCFVSEILFFLFHFITDTVYIVYIGPTERNCLVALVQKWWNAVTITHSRGSLIWALPVKFA